MTLPRATGGNPSARQPAQAGMKTAAPGDLKLASQIRAEANSYRIQTEMRARSEAQRLLLDARLSIKRELAKLEIEAGEQARKLLADIRVIRLAALQELEAQRQFTRAAKISALADAVQDIGEKVTKD